jgi:hypothetical protein
MSIMNVAIEPILALVIGILILLVPRFLNYFVAVYLIWNSNGSNFFFLPL